MHGLRLLLVGSLTLAIVALTLATAPGKAGRVAFVAVGERAALRRHLLGRCGGDDVQRLTDHTAFDACAAYSPNGRMIAFCSDSAAGTRCGR